MKKAIALFAMVLAALALVACGGDDDSDTTAAPAGGTATTCGGGGGGGGGGGETLKLSADPSGALAYDTDKLSAKKAGQVTIDFDNPAAIQHDVSVEDSSGKSLGTSDLIAQSNTTLAVNLKPGTYTYFCTVPGHREGGMEGTLTVK
jgi:plastocyanin